MKNLSWIVSYDTRLELSEKREAAVNQTVLAKASILILGKKGNLSL
jgi:hypothetical protein